MAEKKVNQEHPAGMPRREMLARSAAGVAGAMLAGRSFAAGPQETDKEFTMEPRTDDRPNILFVMTDQQRADTIAAMGNPHIYTPNLDRLVARGLAFTKAYSTCPVCVPARYTVRTGREPLKTTVYCNGGGDPVEGQAESMEGRCGPYLARTMSGLGYRTFGIGKFHTVPRYEDLGYEVHIHSEEMYGSQEERDRDGFASFIAREHPEYDWIETLMGERTEMYYMPQMSQMPAECTVESWAADRAVEQLSVEDERPFFGFVSFIGPHPPCAPPLPFNRMYDPDRMPNPIKGEPAVDLMDDQIPWMNYAIWAEDINDSHARVVKARYYGEISYIDDCLGRILDAVEARPDADNTLICFYADHGDHLGDHHAWQKESFFQGACNVPFLVSWPARLPKGTRRDEIVCLTDLFGIATTAAGRPECRDGINVLQMVEGEAAPRERLFGYYGRAGTPHFKVMVREGKWKYIFMARGGREQLFDLEADPQELRECAAEHADMVQGFRRAAVEQLKVPNGDRALDGNDLRTFAFQEIPRTRIYQFDGSRGVTGFPEQPEDAIQEFRARG